MINEVTTNTDKPLREPLRGWDPAQKWVDENSHLFQEKKSLFERIVMTISNYKVKKSITSNELFEKERGQYIPFNGLEDRVKLLEEIICSIVDSMNNEEVLVLAAKLKKEISHRENE